MPAIVRSSYLQYKADSAQITHWLGNTAVNHNFSLQNFAVSNKPLADDDFVPRKTTEQERRARKKANAKATAEGVKDGGSSADVPGKGDMADRVSAQTDASSITKDEQRDKQYLLTTKEYISAAKHLVKKGVAVPVEFMRLLRRCINERIRTSKHFSPSISESHHHFIKILQEVETILGPLCPSFKAKIAAGGQAPADGNGNPGTNRYASLDEDQAEDVADIVLPEPSRPAGTDSMLSIIFAKAAEGEDIINSLLLFFQDIHATRDYIKALWSDFREGGIDLFTAAVTTNTAISFLRKLHQSIERSALPSFPRGPSEIQHCLYDCLRGNILPSRPLPLHEDTDPEDAEIYEYLLIPNYQIVGGLGDLLVDGTIPTYREGAFGKYDPLLCGTGNILTPFVTRWNQNNILLCESFFGYVHLLKIGDMSDNKWGKGDPNFERGKATTSDIQSNFFYFDEIAVEMQNLVDTKDASLLLLACSQIFIDINMLLGVETFRGQLELRRTARHMKEMIDLRGMIEPRDKPESWPAENEKHVQMLRDEADYWSNTDPLRHLFKNGLPTTRLLPDNGQQQRKRMGFNLANAWGTILSVAHLHQATRHYDNAPQFPHLPKWPEMETILELHSSSDMFVGDAPKDIEESYESYLRMVGASPDVLIAARSINTTIRIPDALARRFLENKIDYSFHPSPLKDHTRILPIFEDQFVGSGRPAGGILDMSQVEKLLIDLSKKAEEMVYGAAGPRGGNGNGSGNDKSTKRVRLRRRRKHNSAKFSTTQLLSVLEAGLDSETASIRFDYIAMHIQCIRILRAVREKTQAYFVKKHGPAWIAPESRLAEIVLWILQVAALSGRAGKILMGDSDVLIASKVLVDARMAVREDLLAHGAK